MADSEQQNAHEFIVGCRAFPRDVRAQLASEIAADTAEMELLEREASRRYEEHLREIGAVQQAKLASHALVWGTENAIDAAKAAGLPCPMQGEVSAWFESDGTLVLNQNLHLDIYRWKKPSPTVPWVQTHAPSDWGDDVDHGGGEAR